MDARMMGILESFENNSLGLDDTFQFKCRGCGKCCNNREDILLTARDLYNIAKELCRTIEEVFERYCESYVGSSSRIPIVRLKPSGPENKCPLLYNKRCIVHKNKPVVCALFPLGRATGMMKTENGPEKPDDMKPKYFVQPIECGTLNQTHTVRSWLGQFGIPAEDEFYEVWTDTVTSISDFFRRIEKKNVTPKTMGILWSAAFSMLYFQFDTKKDLLPQFRENRAKLLDFIAKTEEMADMFFGGGQVG